ncbi:biopolymer transporter ExbD [Hydrogenophaga sp. 5NK40-0174]|uniref:ExbD/TolR family protein n=1 Tax=Hydrogenophaga sp. 5NK40-0174 TaxID=3127649 RepID=UPI0031083CB9
MNFRSGSREEPEINLIPFIDILLVILIFLMLTTTYNKFTELKVNLPVANAETMENKPQEIIVAISADGRYSVDQDLLPGADVPALTSALTEAASSRKNAIIVISADAAATHQSVINVMDAARRADLVQITFATQNAGKQGGN